MSNKNNTRSFLKCQLVFAVKRNYLSTFTLHICHSIYTLFVPENCFQLTSYFFLHLVIFSVLPRHIAYLSLAVLQKCICIFWTLSYNINFCCSAVASDMPVFNRYATTLVVFCPTKEDLASSLWTMQIFFLLCFPSTISNHKILPSHIRSPNVSSPYGSAGWELLCDQWGYQIACPCTAYHFIFLTPVKICSKLYSSSFLLHLLLCKAIFTYV